MSLTNCRFYEEKFPEIDAFVMVNVKQIAEMGAYVKLLEYDQIDGMILLSELSRRRIRSIQKLIRVGRNEVVVVLRVDKEKGYIDLSKRRVSPEDVLKCEERYNKSKMVHSVMRHVAEKVKHPIEDLYEQIVWPLNRKYGHSIDAFKLSITNQEIWRDVTFPNDVVRLELISYISKRLTPQPTKVRSDIEVTCYGYDGIDAIKTALRTAEAHNPPPPPEEPPKPAVGTSKRSKRNPNVTDTEQAPPQVNGVNHDDESPDTTAAASATVDAANVDLADDTPAEARAVARAVALLATPSVKVKLVSPPLYVLTTQCLEKSSGIKTLEEAIERIRKSIVAAGGALDVKMAPKAVTESDDKELQELMERRERENMEVSGDESGDAEISGEEGVKGD